jgi:hypothetical protein
MVTDVALGLTHSVVILEEAQWFMPVIPAALEVEDRRIMDRGQSRQKLVRPYFNS